MGKPDGNNISSRPGRIDTIIKFSEPTMVAYRRLCIKVLNNRPDLWNGLCVEALDNKYTIAQFKNKLFRIALDEHWEKIKSMKSKKCI